MFHDDIPAARQLVHEACQPLSRAARANLPAADDDSHSAFHWTTAAGGVLRTQPMSRTTALAFGFDPARYVLLVDDVAASTLLLETADRAAAIRWLDDELGRRGLRPSGQAEMPYALPFTADWSRERQLAPAIAALGRWYAAADAGLRDFVATLPSLTPGPSAITVWPHHFDIATLVRLEAGDPESAPSVGVGFSPGDDNYPLPYLYCSPYPAPDDVHRHDPPPGWRWHTDGFTALVMNEPPAQSGSLGNAFRQAFQVAMASYGDARPV